MKNSLLLMAVILILSSCAKEEFVGNKGSQNSAVSQLASTTTQLCSQHTLISPQVDILMLWDNSSSFNFVTSATKASMSNLITSVSENFDYHLLTAPLVPASSTALYESQLVVKNNTGLSGNAVNIVKSKDQAIASLSFTMGNGSAEVGVDRAIQVIEANRANGIFRPNAYTMIVVISNEDDKGCGLNGPVCNNNYDKDQYLAPRLTKLLCLRGNTTVDCSSSGVSSPLNSAMMRFINISPLTLCASGNYKANYSYRKVAKTLYEAPYTNGWPTSNDHLSPDVSGAPDSYNLCSIDFSHIFDGVNTAIKQTLIKHVYDYWPVTGSNTSIDPDTLRVVRSDGKILMNRTGQSSPPDGFAYVGNRTNQATRILPTPGEPFTGKMIQLFGVNGNDRVVYPDCLTVTYDEEKSHYGYIYMQTGGTPIASTIEVRMNGNLVPQSATNGWDYMGLQYINSLDPNYKIVDLPSGANSGYIIRLNGSYRVANTSSYSFNVLFNSGN